MSRSMDGWMSKTWRRGVAVGAAAVLHGLCAAQIVGVPPLSPPLPDCPLAGAAWVCIVDTEATTLGVVGSFEAIRVGRTVSGVGLTVGSGASLILNSTATSANLIVGDPASRGALYVVNGGQVNLNVSDVGGGNSGGLGGGQSLDSAIVIASGGRVNVNKAGGPGVSAAVALGFFPGSSTSMLLDGGIGGFGNPAPGAWLSTTGNISVGRQGSGSLDVFKYANVDANVVNLAVVDPQGSALLNVGFNSTLRASAVYAGIGLNAAGVGDPSVTAHGTAGISVTDGGFLNSYVMMGSGATLRGVGNVARVDNYGGTITPGFSPGRLTLGTGSGAAFSDTGGLLVIEIGDGVGDFLEVLGDLSMVNTSVEFRFVGGFAPRDGFSYDFMEALGQTSLSGVRYSFSGLLPGFTFDVLEGANGGFSFLALSDGVAVPEPSLASLVGLALFAAWAARRRPSLSAKAATSCRTR